MVHLVELQMMSGRCFCIGMVARRVCGSGDVKKHVKRSKQGSLGVCYMDLRHVFATKESERIVIFEKSLINYRVHMLVPFTCDTWCCNAAHEESRCSATR